MVYDVFDLMMTQRANSDHDHDCCWWIGQGFL